MKKVQIIGQKYSKPLFYSFFIYKEKHSEKEYFILSSDYIGPSIEQARSIGKLEDFEIKNFLRISRTLGGHIVWPRGDNMKPTINQVKGGEIILNSGYGFYDRIDWTIFLLKIYYFIIEKSDMFTRKGEVIGIVFATRQHINASINF